MLQVVRLQVVRRRVGWGVAWLVWSGGPLAAIPVTVVCLLAAFLVPLGWWRPEVVWPVLAAAVLATAVPAWRTVKGQAAGAMQPVSTRTAVACLALAVGFTLWVGLTHGEHIVLRRDAGAYALYAQWIATRHGLPITGDLQAFGGLAATHVSGFNLGSPAFYQTHTGTGADTVVQVTPQFLVGAPALCSLGWWLAGWLGVFWVPAVLAGLGVLAFAGLAVRLVGSTWAAPATAALAVTQPLLHTARATYSEPASLLMLLAGAVLAADAVTERRPCRARRLGVAAGLLVGLIGLVRVDSLREVALLVPVCAVLAVRRHPAAIPLAVAALAGTAVSAVPALWFSRPYLQGVWGSLQPLVIVTVALAVVAAATVGVGRRRTLRSGPAGARRWSAAGRYSPVAAAVLVVAGGVWLTARPLWTVSRQSPGDPSQAMIESIQRIQGLPVDGLRTYGEQSVQWVLWYVGPFAALAALVTFAALAAAAVRWWQASAVDGAAGAVPAWLVPSAVAAGSVLLTLYRPGITPDHPWADRRLVPVVLPATMLAASAAMARGTELLRRRQADPRRRAAVQVVAVLALVAPAAAVTAPLVVSRTEVGEPRAVAQVCSALGPGDVVAMVSDADGGERAQNEWVQVVRGVCGHPSVSLAGPPPRQQEAVRSLGPLVQGAGHRLVLLAAGGEDGRAATALAALGTTPIEVVALTTQEDRRMLVQPAFSTTPLVHAVWIGVWQGPPS